MFELTYGLLQSRLTPEAFDDYLLAATVLEQSGKEDLFERLEAYITEVELPDDIITDIVKGEIYKGMKYLVQEFTIIPNDDIYISDLVKIVQGITLVEDYEGVNEIFDILTSDLNNEEKLAESLCLATATGSEDYLNMFKSVDHALINRMVEMFRIKAITDTRHDQLLMEQSTRKVNTVRRIKQILNAIGHEDLVVVEYIRSNGTLQLPFLTLFNLLKDDIFSETGDFLAENLYLLATISEGGLEDPITLLKDHMPEIDPDIQNTTKLIEDLRKLSIEISNHG